MKLLFDESLSPKLIDLLSDLFPDSESALRNGLAGVGDSRILDYASEGGFVLVSTDADFDRLIGRVPSARVVILRSCNYPTSTAAAVLRRNAVRVAELDRTQSHLPRSVARPWSLTPARDLSHTLSNIPRPSRPTTHSRVIPIPRPPMPSKTTPIDRSAINRAALNRKNAQHSCGPRTIAGKQRSSLNALRHGLTAASPTLPGEDAAAYATHRRSFFDEHQPATPTETQLVQELADTAWRLNRIPRLEAHLLARAANPPNEEARIAFDIVDAHRLIANLSLQSQRLSRQFQKALATLREIQAERQTRERRQLREAAALLEFHKHKGLPWQPSDDGFVFSKGQVESFARRAMRQNDARQVGYVCFEMPPNLRSGYERSTGFRPYTSHQNA